MATTTRRFTIAQVEAMAAAGVFGGDERCELIDGELVTMTPQGAAHAATLTRLVAALRAAPADRFQLRPRLPLVCGDRDLPEPDVAIVRGGPGDVDDRHPRGDEAGWSSRWPRPFGDLDRRKAAIYARAGCGAYWLVDIPARIALVHEGRCRWGSGAPCARSRSAGPWCSPTPASRCGSGTCFPVAERAVGSRSF